MGRPNIDPNARCSHYKASLNGAPNPTPPSVPLLTAVWPLIGGIWGVLHLGFPK